MVDNGSHDGSVAALRARVPRRARSSTPATNLGYAGGREPRHRRHDARRSSRCCNPDPVVGRAPRRPMLAPVRRRARPRARWARRCATPTARSTRRPGRRRRRATRSVTRCSVWSAPTNRFTRRYRQLDADPAAAPRRRLALGRGPVAPAFARSTSVGGWDERYFMYLEDVDLCWRLRRLGWRVAYEPGRHRDARAGVSTSRHPYRMIVRAPPVRVPVRGRQELARPAAPPARSPPRCSSWRARVAIAARALGARPGQPQRQRIASLSPCRSPADVLGAPPCVPVIASRSAVGADRWAGTSPSPRS